MRAFAVDGPGMTGAPKLAAALIVRDEEAVLGRCLESLRGVVDDIYVHDTGSTDRTVDIATGYGAHVSEGPWTHDFAAARNAVLDRVDPGTGWVLSVDADEEAVADARRLRRALAGSRADLLAVSIENVGPSTFVHQAPRLFRRARCRWTAPVHEQIVARDGGLVRFEGLPTGALMLRHSGYADAAKVAVKNERNVRIAQATVEGLAAQGGAADPGVVARTLLDLGRACLAADRGQEAVDAFEMVRELFPGTVEWARATDALARQLINANMPDVVLVLAGELRGAGFSPSYCDWLMAHAMLRLGDRDAARRLAENITELVNVEGTRLDPSALADLRRVVGARAA
ncbi:hypothetical protein GCM10009682_61760 [Luedemannella flava]|uniref:Glycosyltransferase 2-like domain-containing protein n=1 Tax=Luedemannella flava TaxID=349316 RepID=A0ABN2MR41_9ACTN